MTIFFKFFSSTFCHAVLRVLTFLCPLCSLRGLISCSNTPICSPLLLPCCITPQSDLYSTTGLVELLPTEISPLPSILVIYLTLLGLPAFLSNLLIPFHRYLVPGSQCGYWPNPSLTLSSFSVCHQVQGFSAVSLCPFSDLSSVFHYRFNFDSFVSFLPANAPPNYQTSLPYFPFPNNFSPHNPYTLCNETQNPGRKHEKHETLQIKIANDSLLSMRST